MLLFLLLGTFIGPVCATMEASIMRSLGTDGN